MNASNWIGLVILGHTMVLCANASAAFPEEVANYSEPERREAFLNEIAALTKKSAELEKRFTGRKGILERKAFLIWEVARACGFDLQKMHRDFPELCLVQLDILMADQKDGEARLLFQSRDPANVEQLELLHGPADNPKLATVKTSVDSKEWNGLDVDDIRFHCDKLVERDGKLFVVGGYSYHPFPKDATWPKWQLWAEVRGGELIPNRIERYDLPADEDDIKPEHLGATFLPRAKPWENRNSNPVTR